MKAIRRHGPYVTYNLVTRVLPAMLLKAILSRLLQEKRT